MSMSKGEKPKVGRLIMSECIKRETAARAVMSAKWVDDSDRAMAMGIVMTTPAADDAHRVHGKWIHYDDGVFTCSECGNAESNDSYYCRYCGAKMDDVK